MSPNKGVAAVKHTMLQGVVRVPAKKTAGIGSPVLPEQPFPGTRAPAQQLPQPIPHEPAEVGLILKSDKLLERAAPGQGIGRHKFIRMPGDKSLEKILFHG